MAEDAAKVAITMPDPNDTTIDEAPNHHGFNAATISASNGGLGSPVAPAPVAIVLLRPKSCTMAENAAKFAITMPDHN